MPLPKKNVHLCVHSTYHILFQGIQESQSVDDLLVDEPSVNPRCVACGT